MVRSALITARRVAAAAAAVIRDCASAIRDHRSGGEAARVAHYAFLSFFPAVLVVLSVSGVVGGPRVFEVLVQTLRAILPGVASDELRRFVADAMETPRPGLASVGTAVVLWASSNAVAALALALNTVFGVERARVWWRRRLLGLVVALAGAGAGVLTAAAQRSGRELLAALGFELPWGSFRAPAAFLLLAAAAALLYRFLPHREGPRSRRALASGAAAGAALWMAANSLLDLWLDLFSGYGAYGVMSGVVVLQVWLYLTVLSLLVGAELAAALERRWPARPRER